MSEKEFGGSTLKFRKRRTVEENSRMVTARDLDDLKAFDFKALDHGMINPQEPAAVWTASPGRLRGAARLSR